MLSTVEIQPYCLVKQMINTFLTFDFYRILKNLSPFSNGPVRCTLYSKSLASNPRQFHLTFVYITWRVVECGVQGKAYSSSSTLRSRL